MNNTAPLVPVCSTGHRRVGLPVDKDLCVQLLGSEGSRRKMGSSRHGRAFGGGGFARTMELQRNRRRSAFRKTSFARQSQQQAAAQEARSLYKIFSYRRNLREEVAASSLFLFLLLS